MILAASAGCSSVATRMQFYKPIATEARNGNYQAAAAKIDAARAKNKFAEKDRLLYLIDSGLLYHYAENYDTSNARLTRAENAADELFTKSISRAAASMVLNDNILEYAGEDYEVLYTNLIKALNYSRLELHDDAFVEIRRANEKLQLLDQKYGDAIEQIRNGQTDDNGKIDIDYGATKVRFNNDAFARYLSMHMYANEGKYDDARIDYNLLDSAFITQPHIYGFNRPDVKYSSDSLAILSIVGLAGMAPIKEPLNLRIRTDRQLKLIQVLYTDGNSANTEYGHFFWPIKEDFYFKFAIPRIVAQPSSVVRINVIANGQQIGPLQLIEDVSKVAEETFNAKKSLVYFRAVVRCIAKGLSTHKFKSDFKKDDLGSWLAKAAIDVASDITENADLRCTQFLPGKIYVGDFELKPGIYDLKIQFLGGDGQIIRQTEIPQYNVIKNRFNLIEAVGID
jgi:hypothetical protein